MIAHSFILDAFLDDFAAARAWADEAAYEDVINPADGVVYPGICMSVPLREEIITKLSAVFGHCIVLKYLFARRSPRGVTQPHRVHTDALMAQYTLVLYMNRPENCRGGTTLVIHRNGMERNPQDQAQVEVWRRDHADDSKWLVVGGCPMVSNRAYVLKSDLFHRAEPAEGFGERARDARLVVCGFFDLE